MIKLCKHVNADNVYIPI